MMTYEEFEKLAQPLQDAVNRGCKLLVIKEAT